jgi:hypothetical protein
MVPMAGRSEPLTSDVELRETNRLGQRLRIRAGSVKEFYPESVLCSSLWRHNDGRAYIHQPSGA